jgi:hypothetical protein
MGVFEEVGTREEEALGLESESKDPFKQRNKCRLTVTKPERDLAYQT